MRSGTSAKSLEGDFVARVELPELMGAIERMEDLVRTPPQQQEISRLKTERTEPQIRACVQAYKLQMELQKHFVHKHPKDSTSWEMPEFQPLVSDPRVHSIDGPMCRWSLKVRGSNDKVEFMRKQTR